MPKALRYLAVGGQKAANQGDSAGDRMWERRDIRQAGDPVECSCSSGRLNRPLFPERLSPYLPKTYLGCDEP